MAAPDVFHLRSPRVVIIYNERIKGKPKAPGYSIEFDLLRRGLARWSVSVQCAFQNQTREDILEIVNGIGGSSDGYDGLILIVRSHGEIDGVLGSDGGKVLINEIREPLESSSSWARKPKLIFFEACRTADGVELGKSGRVDFDLRDYCSSSHDCWIGYATQEFRPARSGIYLMHLGRALLDAAPHLLFHDIVTLAHQSIRQQDGYTEQVPEVVSRLDYNCRLGVPPATEQPPPAVPTRDAPIPLDGNYKVKATDKPSAPEGTLRIRDDIALWSDSKGDFGYQVLCDSAGCYLKQSHHSHRWNIIRESDGLSLARVGSAGIDFGAVSAPTLYRCEKVRERPGIPGR